jgi:acyl-CoA reductase-like NAD-dependent aldehyde dehydrogenase
VLLNSHDGTSAYRVMSGVFRLVCLNGMVVADRQDAEVRVPHKGEVVRQVVEGSYAVLDDARRALDAAEAWQAMPLARDEQRAFGEAARLLRFGDAEGNTDTPITSEQLLAPRRAEDAGDDLWRTFNRVQENVIRGGLTSWGRDARGRSRRITSREVTGIDGDVRLNRALWQLAERMAQIKVGGCP